MRVVTAREMKEIDRKTIEEYGLPGLILMENAGLAVANAASDLLGGLRGKRITVLAGKGNNGGDGFVAARHMKQRGAKVRVLLFAEPEKITGDAAVNLRCLDRLSIETDVVDGEKRSLRFLFSMSDLVIDAVFGTGFHGDLPPAVDSVFAVLNDSRCPKISVDMPSGVSDTGGAAPNTVRADLTVTFGLPKLGQLLLPGASYCGRILVSDIGLPLELLTGHGQYQLITPGMVKTLLPRRHPGSHKGDFGRLLGIAGSRGMVGAASLAAAAATRSGAGTVRVATPCGVWSVLAVKLTESMTLSLPETASGCVDETALGVLAEYLPADAVFVGPGLGRGPGVDRVVSHFVFERSEALVLDADGLNSLAGMKPISKPTPREMVMTPHPGEMARLLNCTVQDIQSDRIGAVRKVASRWNCAALLKGARTLVCGPTGPVYINPTGNPGMASGGMGDVLTGVIGAFLGYGMDAVAAAAAGAYIHGLAGDFAAEEKGCDGLVASDVVERLPEALKRVRTAEEDWMREIPGPAFA